MLKRIIENHPIDVVDKFCGKITRFLNPITKRRKITFDEYKNEIINEPSNDLKPKIIFAVDDLSSLGSIKNEIDMGGKVEGEIIKAYKLLITEGLKITSYVIPKPCFKKSSELLSSYINRDSFPLQNDFVDWNKKGFIEIAQHGLKHMRLDGNNFCRSMEFEWKKKGKISEEIIQGYKYLSQQFEGISTFKPPAWSVGQLNSRYSLVKSLLELNYFKYVSLSSPTNGVNYKNHILSHIHPSTIKIGTKEIRNIPQNISVLTPIKQSKELIKIICDKGGIISIQTHACLDSNIIADGLSLQHCNVALELTEYAKKMGASISLTKDL